MTSQFAKSLEALQLHFDNFWQYMEAFSTKTNSRSFFLDLKKKCDELKRFLEGHIEDEGSHAIPEDEWFGLQLGTVSETQKKQFPYNRFVDLLINIQAIGSTIRQVDEFC